MPHDEYNDGTRPSLTDRWYRAHGLGNDYIVFERGDAWVASEGGVEAVCHRTTGVGSDGIVALLGEEEPFPLRMFNPDGSEFERSGNGLRILGSWLHRTGRVGAGPFRIRTGGDEVRMEVHGVADGLYDISVEMGRAVVGPPAVELDEGRTGPGVGGARPNEVAFQTSVGDDLRLVPVSVGTPHAVVWGAPADFDRLGDESLHRIGSAVAADPAFAHGVNVQLARLLRSETGGGGEVEIRIWERGVGPTSASGTSSCAVAVAAVATGRLAPGEIRVRMPGGELLVTVGPGLEVVLRGPVEAVAEGTVDAGWLRRVDASRR